MNKTEFNSWWKDYAGRFPSVNAWINSLGDDVATRQLSLWLEILEPVDLKDALEVSKRMSLGTLEPVGSFPSERERTAIYIRRAAQSIAGRRDVASESTGTLQAYRPQKRAARSPVAMRGLLSKLVRFIESGRTRDEAANEVFGEPLEDDDRRLRVRCTLCSDVGTLSVWHYRTILAYREDPALIDNRANRLVMAVPCSCDAGSQFVGSNRAWENDAVRYDSTRYCIAENGDITSEKALDEFLGWCAAFFDKIDYENEKRLEALHEPKPKEF